MSESESFVKTWSTSVRLKPLLMVTLTLWDLMRIPAASPPLTGLSRPAAMTAWPPMSTAAKTAVTATAILFSKLPEPAFFFIV
jgi:hypothetical protein